MNISRNDRRKESKHEQTKKLVENSDFLKCNEMFSSKSLEVFVVCVKHFGTGKRSFGFADFHLKENMETC